jgi:cell division protein FtsB
MKSFPQYLATTLLTGTRKHFSRLHADYLQEIQMSEQLQHPKTDAQIVEQKHAQIVALQARVTELEIKVAALEGRS